MLDVLSYYQVSMLALSYRGDTETVRINKYSMELGNGTDRIQVRSC